MFDLFNKKLIQELEDTIKAQAEHIQELNRKILDYDHQINDLETQLKKLLKPDNDPWFQVIGIPDVDNGIKLDADWNAAFIDILKDMGFNGVNHEIIIQTWLVVMSYQLAQSIDVLSDKDELPT